MLWENQEIICNVHNTNPILSIYLLCHQIVVSLVVPLLLLMIKSSDVIWCHFFHKCKNFQGTPNKGSGLDCFVCCFWIVLFICCVKFVFKFVRLTREISSLVLSAPVHHFPFLRKESYLRGYQHQIFSRVLRYSIGHYVGRSIRPSVRYHFAFFLGFWTFWT